MSFLYIISLGSQDAPNQIDNTLYVAIMLLASHMTQPSCSAIGYRAFDAYNTYKDSDLMNLAVKAWALGRNYTLSDEDMASGRTPVKSFAIRTTCGNGTPVEPLLVLAYRVAASMAGGSFWVGSQYRKDA